MNPELQTVVGWGPESAEIMIVNDYPSREEIQQGKALVGNSGRLISRYLSENDYDINKCFKTCYIKLPFSMPRAKKKQLSAVEAIHKEFEPESFQKTLAKEILEVNPNVIISVGELSTFYLTGRRKVDKLRGSILPLADIPRMDCGEPAKLKQYIRVVPVLSPRDIAAKWMHNAYAPIDYAKAIKVRTRMDQIRENSLLWIARDAKSLITWWSERGCKSKFLTFDIETYANFITCISFCGDGYEALSVPFVDKSTGNFDRALMLKTVAKILKSPIPKVNQNVKYDHHMLEQWGFELENIAGDTMLLGHCIYPELPKGLDFYTSIFTDFAYYKDDGRDFNPKQGWDVLYIYNAKDSLSAWQIYEKQIEEAKEVGVWDFYKDKVWPCYHVYKKMDDRGIAIDETEKSLLNSKYGEILDTHHGELAKLTGKSEINYNSPKQIQLVVYKDLALPPQWKRDKDGNKVLTTDEETLEELILNHSKDEETRKILWEIIWCRKIHKALGYINTPYHWDGRMRTWTKLTGTKSGRNSMSETVDKLWFKNSPEHPWYNENKKGCKILQKELGLSFQTIPKHGIEVGDQTIGKDIRKMYVPSRGYTFVEGDGGQAEARVVAILAEDYSALEEMERKNFQRNRHRLKDDLHTKTCMLVLGMDFEEVTEAYRQDFGKKPRHAGNYDMGPKRLSLMAHISFTRAATALSKFHSFSPKIREVFHTTVRTLVTNVRMLSTLHGRQRQFFDKLTDETFKQAYSYIPQAVVSDHMKFDTIVPLMQFADAFSYFLSESHDSGFFEVLTEQVEPFCLKFKELEESPLIFNQGSFVRERQLIIPLEIKTSSTNWYEMQELKF